MDSFDGFVVDTDDMDGMFDECAVAAVYNVPDASAVCKKILFMTQHRGPKASGICTWSERKLHLHKAPGLVREIFTRSVIQGLPGSMAIGHNRYMTNDGSDAAHQPHVITSKKGRHIAGASNGDVPRSKILIDQLRAANYELRSENDGEAITALLAKYLDELPDGGSDLDAFRRLMNDPELRGAAYSAVFIVDGTLWIIRDPLAFRPLSLARFGDGYIVASETCGFDIIQANYIRDIHPGEIVCIDENGERGYPGAESQMCRHCIFCFVYFARPDSRIFGGQSVSLVRKRFGAALWPHVKPFITADPGEYIVIGVPDSANNAANGLAQASGISFELGLVRSHYIGRGFLDPEQAQREKTAVLKYNPDAALVKGKRVIVVEDSIVRGTTLRLLVRMLRLAGAMEVIVVVSSPEVKWSCFYGIDTPTLEELIASRKSVDEICREIEADRLVYLPLGDMLDCVHNGRTHFCHACFSGEYPYRDSIPEEKFALK